MAKSGSNTRNSKNSNGSRNSSSSKNSVNKNSENNNGLALSEDGDTKLVLKTTDDLRAYFRKDGKGFDWRAFDFYATDFTDVTPEQFFYILEKTAERGDYYPYEVNYSAEYNSKMGFDSVEQWRAAKEFFAKIPEAKQLELLKSDNDYVIRFSAQVCPFTKTNVEFLAKAILEEPESTVAEAILNERSSGYNPKYAQQPFRWDSIKDQQWESDTTDISEFIQKLSPGVQAKMLRLFYLEEHQDYSFQALLTRHFKNSKETAAAVADIMLKSIDERTIPLFYYEFMNRADRGELYNLFPIKKVDDYIKKTPSGEYFSPVIDLLQNIAMTPEVIDLFIDIFSRSGDAFEPYKRGVGKYILLPLYKHERYTTLPPDIDSARIFRAMPPEYQKKFLNMRMNGIVLAIALGSVEVTNASVENIIDSLLKFKRVVEFKANDREASRRIDMFFGRKDEAYEKLSMANKLAILKGKFPDEYSKDPNFNPTKDMSNR
ncbi:MAG: hypothetical protein LBM38_02535 [Clostridiales bacterium]|nr:hypothetical protein [Clostridiales bacterium]